MHLPVTHAVCTPHFKPPTEPALLAQQQTLAAALQSGGAAAAVAAAAAARSALGRPWAGVASRPLSGVAGGEQAAADKGGRAARRAAAAEKVGYASVGLCLSMAACCGGQAVPRHALLLRLSRACCPLLLVLVPPSHPLTHPPGFACCSLCTDACPCIPPVSFTSLSLLTSLHFLSFFPALPLASLPLCPSARPPHHHHPNPHPSLTPTLTRTLHHPLQAAVVSGASDRHSAITDQIPQRPVSATEAGGYSLVIVAALGVSCLGRKEGGRG